MKKYDYLIVGAGLFGAVFAHEATRRGKTCLVIDKRGHIEYLHRRSRGDPGTQIRCTYLPYFQKTGVGLYQSVCRI